MGSKFKKIICSIVLVTILASVVIYKLNYKEKINYNAAINISELSDEFMQNYFEGVERLRAGSNEENILIVTSLNGIPDTYGATDVVSAPNNQYFLQYKNEDDKNKALEKFNKSKEIMFVGENIIYTIDSTSYNSWGVEAMGIDKAIPVTESNDLNEVVVAIIDSGCNTSAIDGRYPGKIKETYNVLNSSTDVTDSSGHGTHIAGTIAESTPSNVKILPIRASLEDNPGNFSNADIITAINYVVYNKKAQVINMSFGSDSYDKNLFIAITAANDENIICVAAAGNDSTSANHYPSGYNNTISVSAVDSDFGLADYSNYGKTITFAAPGTDIVSVNGTKSGTSMATPHVASAVAIMKSFYPEYDMQQVIDELKEYTIDLGTPGWDEKFGYGFVYFNVNDLCDLNEGCIFKDDGSNENVNRLEAADFVAKENYGTISNILDAQIKIYHSETNYVTKQLWELDDLEILNYDPYDYTVQNVTIKYAGSECTLVVDNTNNTKSSWQYELIDEDKGYIKITKWNPHDVVRLRKMYIPSKLDGYTVKEIGDNVFEQNEIIYYYYLPESIDTIGKSAFNQSVIVELNSLAPTLHVEKDAFYNCISLEKFTSALSYVGDYAFRGCESLTSVIFTDDIDTIGESAFYHCIGLTEIDIPDSVTSVGDYAFFDCDNLESIYISQYLTSIGQNAFSAINELRDITVDPLNPVYDSREDCSAIIETETNTLIQGSGNTVIPNSIKVIGDQSFNEIASGVIIVPEGVETIGSRAFYTSVSEVIDKVVLPRTVTSIASDSFRYYLDLKTEFWVYRDSYADTFMQDTNFTYLYRDENIYDIKVTLAKNNFSALETLDVNDVSISLVYYDGDLTTTPYSGDVYVTYVDGNGFQSDSYFNADGEYIILGVKEGTRMVSKKVHVNVSKLVPEYEVPENLTGKTNTLLSSVELPEHFEWMNPSQKITEVGTHTYKAMYIPGDKNYQDVKNIDVDVIVTDGKELVIPEISIADKLYDGTTNIDLNNITITNLNDGEYTIKSAVVMTPNVGNKTVALKLKLSDEKYEEYTFDNGESEKVFIANMRITPMKLTKPTAVEKTYTYNGEEQEIELENFDSTLESVTGNTRTNAGSQDVVISLRSPNYVWEDDTTENVTLSFVINAAIPNYTVPTNLEGISGNTLSTVSLPEYFEWVDSAQLMIAGGNQVFKARYVPDDNNYAVVEDIDITINVLIIKETIIPNITVEDKTYDGTMNVDLDSITVSNLNDGEYEVVNALLNSSDVGSTTVVITLRLSDEKYLEYEFSDGSQENTFIVNVNILPQRLVKPTAVEKTYTYNGDEQEIELNDFDSDKEDIIGNTRTNAGSQDVVISLKNSNYIWNDDTTEDITMEFTIDKAVPTYSVPENLTALLGKKLSSVELPEHFEWVDGDQHLLELGSQVFKARYVPSDIDNYTIVEDIDITVTVAVKSIITPNITIQDKTYDGTTNIDLETVAVTNLNAEEYTVISGELNSSDAGETTASITLRLSDDKFIEYAFENGVQEKTFTVNATILPQKLVKPTKANRVYTYTGEEQTLVLNNFDSEKENITNNTRTNAGYQDAIVSLKNSNYAWMDGTVDDVVLQFIIGQASLDVQDSTPNSVFTYDGNPHSLTLKLNKDIYNVKYMDEDNHYTLDVSPEYTDVGVYMVRYRIYIDDNYTEYYGERTLTIAKPKHTVTFYANNGSDDAFTQQVEDLVQTLLNKNLFTYEGYEFISWNTKADGTGDTYADEDEVTLDSDLALYAQWGEGIDYIINNYVVDEINNYISGIMVNTKLNTFTSYITLGYGYGVDVDSKEIDGENVLYTGGKTRITKGLNLYEEYTNVVIGDIDGDGLINSADLLKVRQHLLEINTLTGPYFLASDVNNDDEINSADLLRIRQHLLGILPIE